MNVEHIVGTLLGIGAVLEVNGLTEEAKVIGDLAKKILRERGA